MNLFHKSDKFTSGFITKSSVINCTKSQKLFLKNGQGYNNSRDCLLWTDNVSVAANGIYIVYVHMLDNSYKGV